MCTFDTKVIDVLEAGLQVYKKTATYICHLPDFNGEAVLYHCSPPLEDYDGTTYEYVIASAVKEIQIGLFETYLFPSNPNGDITDWIELPGSQKNTISHATVWNDLGYEIVKD